ncbi:Hypothetical protein PBC10988_33300 [Planctomycetales bacterium 10988]|nr:Hypothetical protein PBC10988_33300 [Planctomycetales bacterium 10988]
MRQPVLTCLVAWLMCLCMALETSPLWAQEVQENTPQVPIPSVPPTEAILKVHAPLGVVITIDGNRFEGPTTFRFRDLVPNRRYHSMVTVSLQGKELANRILFILGGSQIEWAVPELQEAKLPFPPQTGHQLPVTSLDADQVGLRVITGSLDKTLAVWDVASGWKLSELRGHTQAISSVSMSSNGLRAVSGAGSNPFLPAEAFVWNLEDATILHKLKLEETVLTDVAISPDGKEVATGTEDGTVTIWDVDLGEIVRELSTVESPIQTLAFDHSATHLVATNAQGELFLWDRGSGDEGVSLEREPTAIEALAFHPIKNQLLISSQKGTLEVWNLGDGSLLQAMPKTPRPVHSVGFSPTGDRILVGSRDQEVYLLDADSGENIRTFRTGAYGPVTACFTGNDTFVTRGGSGIEASSIQRWRTIDGEQLDALVGRLKPVTGVAFQDGGNAFVTVDGQMWIWNPLWTKVRKIGTAGNWGYREGYLHPDGQTILGISQQLELWKSDGTELMQAMQPSDGKPKCLSWSPKRAQAFTGSEGGTFWNIASGEQAGRIFEHGASLDSADFDFSGDYLITGGHLEPEAFVWDVKTSSKQRILRGHTDGISSVRFDSSGGKAITGSLDGTAKVWDLTDGSELLSLEGHSGEVTAVAFDPLAKLVITGSEKGELFVWDANEGTLLREWHLHQGRIHSLSVHHEGRLVLTGSHDGTARLWDLYTGDELLQLLTTKSGEWLIVSPLGFVYGNDNAIPKLGWQWNPNKEESEIRSIPTKWLAPGLLPRLLSGERWLPSW